ncbi:unnamed protein product [Colias eurytheme]|nr:unnamed protein product [Colias eurytheme]
MNEDLERISDWSRRNSLVLNPSKSKYLVLGSKKQISDIVKADPSIYVNSTPIERVPVARNLGIDFDSQLSLWTMLNGKSTTPYPESPKLLR